MTAQTDTKKRGRGQPPKIDQIIQIDDDGAEHTAAAVIVATMRQDGYLESAAAYAGCAPSTVRGWLALGATARIATDHGQTITDHDQNCLDFLEAVKAAKELWFHDQLALHQIIAAGGVITETVTVTKTDSYTKTTTQRSTTLPDARALEWRMKHVFPARFAERMELTGAGGGPIELSHEEHVKALLSAARESHARKEPATPRAHSPKKPRTKKTDATG